MNICSTNSTLLAVYEIYNRFPNRAEFSDHAAITMAGKFNCIAEYTIFHIYPLRCVMTT